MDSDGFWRVIARVKHHGFDRWKSHISPIFSSMSTLGLGFLPSQWQSVCIHPISEFIIDHDFEAKGKLWGSPMGPIHQHSTAVLSA